MRIPTNDTNNKGTYTDKGEYKEKVEAAMETKRAGHRYR